jgi:threonine dehydratase
VQLKLETLQVTGSFKFRGALNTILTLPEQDRGKEVVAASTGNHGAGVARAAALVGMGSRVFVPETVARPKLARIIRSGAEVTHIPGDPVNAERAARDHAHEHDLPYIAPYNDPAVVAGQATVGLEITRQAPAVPDTVFVPLGGGGLAAGVAIAVKSAWPGTRVVACSPSSSPVMIRSLEAGRVLDMPSLPTLSDGTAGGIEKDSITFELCRGWIDELIEVSEAEIAASLRDMVENELLLIEGAAAVAVAGFRKAAGRDPRSAEAVIVLSGANVSAETLLRILSSRPGEGSRQT